MQELTKTLKVLSADWCNNCTTLKQQLDKLNLEYEVVDIDKNMEFVKEVNIRSLPTTILMQGNEIVKTFVGLKIQEIFNAVKE